MKDHQHFLKKWFPKLPLIPYDGKCVDQILAFRNLFEGELFIDKLLGCFEISLNELYPPKTSPQFISLVSKIVSYPFLGPIQKNSVLYYLLKNENKDSALKFQESTGLPLHFRMLMDGYWSMDRGEYTTALHYFSQPLVEPDWPEKLIRHFHSLKMFKEATYILSMLHPVLLESRDLSIQMDLLLQKNLREAFEFQV